MSVLVTFTDSRLANWRQETQSVELELELELIGLVKPQALNVPLVASNPVVIPLLE